MLRRLAAPAFAVLLVAGGAIVVGACALSPNAEITPEADPSLPSIDAAMGDPTPRDPGGSADAAPGTEGFDDDDADTGTVVSPGTDASPTVDSGPPAPTLPKPTASELLITEVMFDPTGTEPQSEWIELHSLASSERLLAGLTLKDGGGRVHVITGSLTIAANAWVVLARNKVAATTLKVPAAAIVYEYGTGLGDSAGIQLANGSTGGIAVMNGATVVAAAPYGGWFTATGATVQLKVLNSSAAGSKASWCSSLNPWATGADKGTPGAASDCP